MVSAALVPMTCARVVAREGCANLSARQIEGLPPRDRRPPGDVPSGLLACVLSRNSIEGVSGVAL
jgi:hypothetical protein